MTLYMNTSHKSKSTYVQNWKGKSKVNSVCHWIKMIVLFHIVALEFIPFQKLQLNIGKAKKQNFHCLEAKKSIKKSMIMGFGKEKIDGQVYPNTRLEPPWPLFSLMILLKAEEFSALLAYIIQLKNNIFSVNYLSKKIE